MARFLLILALGLLFTPGWSQHDTQKDKDTEGTLMWKPVKPEKLKSSELMILPSSRFLRLNLEEDLGFTKVIIQDLNGITLIENPFDPNRDIDISILKPGNYLIKVISANKVLQGKFGKRRL
ncbi:T9SS type A sorting domain-containing protein [Robertkochia flava]|uniref:T9SS type A sorting domain-containing protein n=1 Tax=Robertkochia flava TaxID=3447986 RepID=UPI001CCF9983|nr:T9SS type A sorting domain-containing protein [Robertkochia marina]